MSENTGNNQWEATAERCAKMLGEIAETIAFLKKDLDLICAEYKKHEGENK